MPQWFRNRAFDRAKYPDERWASVCASADATLLLRVDHHVVRVAGRPALLLTYHWMSAAAADAVTKSYVFEISFTYPAGHPVAPDHVQTIVDRLTFKPVSSTSAS